MKTPSLRPLLLHKDLRLDGASTRNSDHQPRLDGVIQWTELIQELRPIIKYYYISSYVMDGVIAPLPLRGAV